MKIVKARIPVGKTSYVREVELYSLEEAKAILKGKEWDVDIDIYSVEHPNIRIGWLARYQDGDGIFVAKKGFPFDLY